MKQLFYIFFKVHYYFLPIATNRSYIIIVIIITHFILLCAQVQIRTEYCTNNNNDETTDDRESNVEGEQEDRNQEETEANDDDETASDDTHGVGKVCLCAVTYRNGNDKFTYDFCGDVKRVGAIGGSGHTNRRKRSPYGVSICILDTILIRLR